jgi:hypothetical protein
MGKEKNSLEIVVRESEGKRLLGRYKRRWEDNINMYLKR